MVLRLDSDHSTTATPSTPPHAMLTAAASPSLSSASDSDDDSERSGDDALELSERGGRSSSSMSSYDDDAAMIDAIALELNREVEEMIQSKFVVPASSSCGVDGSRVPRRRSQCEKLSFRRNSGSGSGKKNGILSAPSSSSQPAGFGRWSTPVGGDGGPPESVQFYPPSYSSSAPSSPSKSSSSNGRRQRSPLLACGAAALVALTTTVFCQRLQISDLRDELEANRSHRAYLERINSDLLSQLDLRDESLDGYRRTHARMASVSASMGEELGRVKGELAESRTEVEGLKEAERRAERSERRWEDLVGGIGEESRRAVIEKYGPGPHRVQLQVQLPNSDSVETIEVELAPLDKMPHSVHTFLDQVEAGAWDGTEFDLHAGHVFMARGGGGGGPSSSSGGSSNGREGRRRVLTLKFPEFDATYPHDKYTLAFPSPSASSSRPGSDSSDSDSDPDRLEFYVNLQPNAAHHSPRVEKSSAADADGEATERYVEGESCFGKIADEGSRRVVDRMDALRLDGEGRPAEGSVVVRTARIVVAAGSR